jgi:hypothetical protein
MQTLIQEGQYQILEVLEAQDGYKACLCIDVETNNHYKEMIFNIYEKDEDIRRYLPSFFALSHGICSDFVRVMSGCHSITAVFEHHSGTKLKDFFIKLDKNDFETRANYAFMLLEECLILDAMEDFIAYGVLSPEHIVISEKAKKIMINYIIPPCGEIPDNFKPQKLAELFEIIFIKNRYVPDQLWSYIEDLKENRYTNIVSAFSKWKEVSDTLFEEYKKLRKETLLGYWKRKLLSRFKIKKRIF